MDSSLPPRNKKRKIAAASKKDQFYASYNRHQCFALPVSIMHYISKNPSSSEIYQKLAMSCKYFFVKNPILIVSHVSHYDTRGWRGYGNITSGFYVFSKNESFYSSLVSKVHQSDVKTVTFYSQTLFFNEFLFLFSHATEIDIRKSVVTDEDGSVVSLEKLIESLSNVKRVLCYFGTINLTPFSFKEIIKIPHFLTLDVFFVAQIHESFDIECFYAYMKKNKHTKLKLLFSDSITEAYKNRLENIIDEILATTNYDYKPPYICYGGLEATKKKKMSAFCWPRY